MLREGKERLVGIDAWRAILLVLGVCLHAATSPTGWEPWVGVLTHKFRMEAFFAISGLMGALTLPQTDWGTWLKRRWVTLGIPTLSVFLLINGPTAKLMAIALERRGASTADVPAFSIPLIHLWFLFVLLGCVTTLALAYRSASLTKLIVYLGRHENKKLFWPAVFAAFLIFSLIGGLLDLGFEHMFNSKLHSRLVRIIVTDAQLTIARVPYYLVYYTLGWCFGSRKSFSEYCKARRNCLLAICAVSVLALVILTIKMGPSIYPYPVAGEVPRYPLLNTVLKSVISLPVSLLILVLATTTRKVPTPVLDFASASYTIYLTHYLALAISWALLGSLGWGSTARFVATTTFALWSGLLVHKSMKGSPILSLLLSGRRVPTVRLGPFDKRPSAVHVLERVRTFNMRSSAL